MNTIFEPGAEPWPGSWPPAGGKRSDGGRNWDQPPPPPPPAAPGRHGHGPRRWRRASAAAALGVAVVAGVGLGWVSKGGPTGLTGKTTAATLTVSQVAAEVDPALVDVDSVVDYGTAEEMGTGIVVTSSGEVLTNNHVVEGATSTKVTDIGNGKTYTATVVGYDTSADVAVLQLKGASGLKTASFGNSSAVAVGQRIVAIGNAGGVGGTPSVATGTVTGLAQAITAEDEGTGSAEQLSGLIETNADIESGDSGGPLVNSSGNIVGMDTAASSGFQFEFGGAAGAQGQATQGYAIPINKALSLAKKIEAGDASSQVHIGATAFLGVELSSETSVPGYGWGYPSSTTSGATIEGVTSGSPAAAAGLSMGDTITSVGGHTVTSASDLRTVVDLFHPGQKVKVTWTDLSGTSESATLTLTSGPTG